MKYIREFNGIKRTAQVYSTEQGYEVIGYYLSKEVRRDDFRDLEIAINFADRWVREECR